jgi:hypothetical protein
MSDLRDAARQALNSLRGYRREINCEQACDAERALEAALTEDALQRLTDANQEIEAALEQPEEPLAWLESPYGSIRMNTTMRFQFPPQSLKWKIPLYTHPPRREWRGLKEWEINDGLDQLPTEDVCSWSFRKGVYFAEAALKEKNND